MQSLLWESGEADRASGTVHIPLLLRKQQQTLYHDGGWRVHMSRTVPSTCRDGFIEQKLWCIKYQWILHSTDIVILTLFVQILNWHLCIASLLQSIQTRPTILHLLPEEAEKSSKCWETFNSFAQHRTAKTIDNQNPCWFSFYIIYL